MLLRLHNAIHRMSYYASLNCARGRGAPLSFSLNIVHGYFSRSSRIVTKLSETSVLHAVANNLFMDSDRSAKNDIRVVPCDMLCHFRS